MLEFGKLKLDPEEIYRVIGGGGNWTRPEVLKVIKLFTLQAWQLLRPRGVYTILPLEVRQNKRIVLDGRFPLTVNTRFFSGASHAALALVTIGPLVEQESARLLAQDKFLDGMVMDSLGTVALDETLGFIRGAIAREVTPLGYKIGYTLSPGCQMIPMEDQVIIFSLLDFEQLEVTLNDDYVMFPAKPLSVIIPLGARLRMTSELNYACAVCALQKTCTFS